MGYLVSRRSIYNVGGAIFRTFRNGLLIILGLFLSFIYSHTEFV